MHCSRLLIKTIRSLYLTLEVNDSVGHLTILNIGTFRVKILRDWTLEAELPPG